MTKNLIQKVLVVNDTYDDNNLGCKATTNALYELIEENLPNYEVSGVLKLFHTERYQIAPYIPETLSDLENLCQEWLSKENQVPWAFEMEKLNKCDVVLVNGEGSIYKQALKGRYQLFISYLSKKYLGKRVFLINHTADVSMLSDFAKVVYSIVDGIVVREPYTKRELNKLGIQNVILAPDAVFKYSLDKNSEFIDRLPFGFKYEKKYIIIGGSSLNHPIYEKWNGPWNPDSFARLINVLKANIDIQIVLADVGGDDFLRHFDQFENVFYGKFNYRDYMLLASRALVHLSGRHHGTCLAAVAGCPVVGLTANTHKMEGDFELLKLNIPIFNFYKIDEQLEKIVGTVETLIKDNSYYRQKLMKVVSALKKDVILNVEILNQ